MSTGVRNYYVCRIGTLHFVLSIMVHIIFILELHLYFNCLHINAGKHKVYRVDLFLFSACICSTTKTKNPLLI
ncbi:Uncharacterised protein [Lysinibacillus sphaericus]|nr:Uncharacterised protein [Lysinibacillus sphaericus]